jgi:5-methylcytosine-specific restriction protein A
VDKHKITNPFYLSQAWRKCREEILLRDNYLCQHCLRRKKITPADMVHHIKPLEDYPALALDPNNLISLCNLCHNREHPGNQYFAKLRKRIIAMLGYPASGKTTYVKGIMTPQDIVLDLDRLVTAMTFRDGHDRTGSAFHAVKIADDMISQAVKNVRAKGYSFDTLYVIRSKLSDEELGSLRAARAKLCWLDVSKDVCLERLRQQGREDIAAVAFKKCDDFLAKHGSKLVKIRGDG